MHAKVPACDGGHVLHPLPLCYWHTPCHIRTPSPLPACICYVDALAPLSPVATSMPLPATMTLRDDFGHPSGAPACPFKVKEP